MPRQRRKRQRQEKRNQDQQALTQLNDRLQEQRKDNSRKQPVTEKKNADRIEKNATERKFSAREVDTIVQAAVTAAVQATVTATKELIVGTSQESEEKTGVTRIQDEKRRGDQRDA
jgi:ubiquitin C-terminal hydrolase